MSCIPGKISAMLYPPVISSHKTVWMTGIHICVMRCSLCKKVCFIYVTHDVNSMLKVAQDRELRHLIDSRSEQAEHIMEEILLMLWELLGQVNASFW